MKRYDKGYVYASLLSDLFSCIVIAFVFWKDYLFEESTTESAKVAIPLFAVGFAVVYLCFIVCRILYYHTSGYLLAETEIKCKRGVLFRKSSVLEYQRVHAINKKQSLFQRFFGIAVLTVDSGSTNTSHQAEIIIIEKAETVDALMHELNARKDGSVPAAEGKGEEVLLSEQDALYRFTSGKKVLYSVINIASTAFFTVLFGVFAIAVIGICNLMLRIEELGAWSEYFFFSVLITFGAMLLLSVFSFVGCMLHSFIGYHGFAITKRGNDIQISYGLLERHTNTFSYDRIKAVKITQGLVQRMLGFAAIRLEVIGYTNGTDDDSKNADIGVLVPFCKYSEVGEILGKVLPDYVPDERQTKAVSYFPFVSWFALTLGIVAGVILLPIVVSMAVLGESPAVMLTVSLAVLGLGAILLAVKALNAAFSYRNNGLALNGSKITAYYGGFVKNVTVFMAKNLIAAESITTPLRKKKGIASLVIHLKTNAASNEIKVHIQKEDLSENLESLLML